MANVTAVSGSSTGFAVRRIYCIGRNYADHVAEMGGSTARNPPIYFTKFPDTLLPGGSNLPYPPQTQNFHFEAELVVALKSGGQNISVSDALDQVFGYACGLDMTKRDLQNSAKNTGAPWDSSKNFSGCAPMGALHSVAEVGHLAGAAISLHQNDQLRQHSKLADMIWSVPEIIANLSRFDALAAGDLIFTGTPAGVGAVVPGDSLIVNIDGLSPLHLNIGPIA
jgi:fumarylpyruvate hydrolase